MEKAWMMTKKINRHLCIELLGRNRLARSAVNPKVGELSKPRSENRTSEWENSAKKNEHLVIGFRIQSFEFLYLKD